MNSSSALCRGGMVLWSAKVPKALRQSSNEPFAQSHAHQKNSGTSFNQVLYVFSFGLIEPCGVCVQYFFKNLNHRYEHKTTAFQVC
ncbi:hypothetical protein FFJ24_014310 [Pedobacter sp. KBS0701]|uniref:hypothetical protein n=1 Tax=Pedobacter sp. KBS0701 TaxID=2578106 RepID=UPI00110EAA33|nr:hypothetical protein [Pedobacter sp. KBS0701]QDW25930.1 hypothetical protein FFJ24_014310 [Pedobacter sp. KBS0701]